MNNLLWVGIGLDVGEKRIGVSRGDTDVRITSPLDPIIRENMPEERVFEKIREISSANGADFVVAGLPRNSNGEETKQSEFSRNFVDGLKKYLPDNVKIYFQDESLTSVKAEENLRRRKNFREEMLRNGILDSEAAAVILGDFLESHTAFLDENEKLDGGFND